MKVSFRLQKNGQKVIYCRRAGAHLGLGKWETLLNFAFIDQSTLLLQMEFFPFRIFHHFCQSKTPKENKNAANYVFQTIRI